MNIQATALSRALGLLKVSGIPYAVIDAEGQLHVSEGYEFHKTPEPKAKAPGTRKQTVPSGSYSGVYVPLIENMKPGDVVVVPLPDPSWNIDWFQASLGSWANKRWGAGSYMTEGNAAARTVTVARIV